ncbi:MAG: hypothetical protein J6V40_02595, partial [Clostridia bacterium]|nr:hypothetical protein [Clostridia bacterium]
MQINNHTLTQKEENTVLYIFNKFHEHFPNVCINNTKNHIIGLGEENRHYMGYFTECDNLVYVKFKSFVDKFCIS